jgi:hypothetical protein
MAKTSRPRPALQADPYPPTASLAKKHGIDKQARTFSAWSQVVTLLNGRRRVTPTEKTSVAFGYDLKYHHGGKYP